MAGNISTASLLRVSGSFFNHFFKVPLSLGDPEAVGLPPRASVIVSEIVKIVIERAASIDIIAIHCL